MSNDSINIASLPEPDIDLDALREELLSRSDRRRRKYWRAKRTFDILFSAAALLLLSPVYLLLALAIYIDDPHGSPIYIQTRIGRKERPFRFYKFRSMVVGAEEMLPQLRG